LNPLPLSFQKTQGGREYWLIGTEEAGSEVLQHIGLDILEHTKVSDEGKAWEGFKKRLQLWSGFFKRSQGILSETEQRGLFGELLELQHMIGNGVSHQVALQGWTGPTGGQHDFALANRIVEVKTLLDSERGKIHISSEYQLEAPAGDLELVVRHVVPSQTGKSLNMLVVELEETLAPECLNGFQELLRASGYLPLEAYGTMLLSVSRENRYSVPEDFPAIRAAKLPKGISKVSYELDLSSISPWLKSKVS
jgi:hypothetical protein